MEHGNAGSIGDVCVAGRAGTLKATMYLDAARARRRRALGAHALSKQNASLAASSVAFFG
jgi:hypothetical protein